MAWYNSIEILSKLIPLAQILVVLLTGFTIWASVQRGNLEKQEKSKLTQQVDKINSAATEKDKKIKELEIKAKKAERGVSSLYDFNGAKRETFAGGSRVIAGEEVGVFQKMDEYEISKAYPELRDLCEGQIKKTPTWLTPYLYLGVAYINLGEKDKAISNLEHVINEAPDDPVYARAGAILEQIRKMK